MSKVITFSRSFPAYHPKAGQPTYFVEKFLNSFNVQKFGTEFIYPFDVDDAIHLNHNVSYETIHRFHLLLHNRVELKDKKFHTIRGGNRFKPGDKFSPRVWSGKPYNSKQIIISNDIEIKKIFDIVIDRHDIIINGKPIAPEQITDLAKNDGLHFRDLLDWFKIPCQFKGQIICWDQNIEY